MLQPNKPIITNPPGSRSRAHGFSAPQIAVLFAAFTLLISIPIWTHPLPPLSDYVNHLARMHVIATLSKNPQLAQYYEIDWQVIPNLTMDLIVPLLARVMNIYLAGQVFIVGMFALIVSGVLALNRALIGRWSVFPLFAFPLLYNYVFLVGLMNYIFGIGVALWALAGWIALRERAWPLRVALSTVCVVTLFFCHLSALGIYGIGVLSFEISRLWERRREPWPGRIADFVASGLPFLAAAPLLYASPTMQLVSGTYWEQRGKIDGLMYVISDYSDIAAFALIAAMVASIVWAVRHRVLRFHPLVLTLLVVGAVVYLALPRIMFDTYMTDQRVPLGVVFMLFACGDLELRRRLVRRAFMVVLIVLIIGAADRDRSQLVAIVGFDQRVPLFGAPHRAGLEGLRRLCRPLARRGRARPRPGACRLHRHHRALGAGHDGVHRGRQAGAACASRIPRLRRHQRRHAAVGRAARSSPPTIRCPTRRRSG